MTKEQYANLRGDGNPMRDPAIAARQAESLRKTWADPEKRKNLSKKAAARWARPGEKEKQSERMKKAFDQKRPNKKWSPEAKLEQSSKMKAYWAKIKAALTLSDN